MIYFIGQRSDTGLMIKIGYTGKCPLSRLSSLQTGSPLKLELIATMPGNKNYEKELHEYFKEFHSRGEWFSFSKPIFEFWLSQPDIEFHLTSDEYNELFPEDCYRKHNFNFRIDQDALDLERLKSNILKYIKRVTDSFGYNSSGYDTDQVNRYQINLRDDFVNLINSSSLKNQDVDDLSRAFKMMTYKYEEALKASIDNFMWGLQWIDYRKIDEIKNLFEIKIRQDNLSSFDERPIYRVLNRIQVPPGVILDIRGMFIQTLTNAMFRDYERFFKYQYPYLPRKYDSKFVVAVEMFFDRRFDYTFDFLSERFANKDINTNEVIQYCTYLTIRRLQEGFPNTPYWKIKQAVESCRNDADKLWRLYWHEVHNDADELFLGKKNSDNTSNGKIIKYGKE